MQNDDILSKELLIVRQWLNMLYFCWNRVSARFIVTYRRTVLNLVHWATYVHNVIGWQIDVMLMGLKGMAETLTKGEKAVEDAMSVYLKRHSEYFGQFSEKDFIEARKYNMDTDEEKKEEIETLRDLNQKMIEKFKALEQGKLVLEEENAKLMNQLKKSVGVQNKTV